jgi:hypothetical protein
MFGTDHSRDWRILARVPLEGLVPDGRALSFAATVRVTDTESGDSLPYVLRRVEPEVYNGRRYLHIQANANRAAVSEKSPRATLSVVTRPHPGGG